MDWWRKLRNNPLARLGAIILLTFYFLVIGADFFAPYDPYSSQIDGSLMPPTAIHWQNGQPKVFPTSQGPTDLETGDRQLVIEEEDPQLVGLFVKGDPYAFLELKLPLPPTFEEKTIFPGFKGDRHLFGVVGDKARLNILGTDEQGRDHFSRLLYGGRISLFIGLVGIFISFPLGMLVGGIAGYFGGWTDAVLMRLVEVLMTIPGIYLLVSLAAILPPSLTSAQRFILIVLITSLISWSGLARVIRGQVLSIKNQEFVQAAQATGGRSLYIITRHILPQTSTYAVISATLAIPGFIIAESVLSLIGLGIQQPDPSWGNLLSLGTNASILVLQPWLVWSPAVLIIITVLAFNLLGDGLRDALDPKNLGRSR
ncbi:binding-protein-dependent transport systems inner membrane component [[Leptolyngbya] sp. PCC 7376]|uniref:ABC transporter permease n=1 Tax=[Leptolyngbya] sp. PCC 7376 TaxID=111781 RepID=UPI00029F1E9F|nr:ABC transporter permease [[Leptolyngbya] sp. PCC 7376]AFY37978.1 binding-protein-dependent transport systems inner membrane component [[Leptolyngbya] sp. PCC 7376]